MTCDGLRTEVDVMSDGHWLGVEWNRRSLGFARDDKGGSGASKRNWLVEERVLTSALAWG